MHWGENVYIGLYRMLGGRWVEGWTAGAPAILLTTTGRRTGLPRTVALGHMRIGRDLVVAGTNGGLAPVPGWVWNLRADPRCQVEAGRERFTATAEFLEGDEYQTHWNRLVSEYPVYQTARDMLERHVPLVVFHPAKE
jgi:deazaflavin-dependent oxidoreductase (nitroreductase family)